MISLVLVTLQHVAIVNELSDPDPTAQRSVKSLRFCPNA